MTLADIIKFTGASRRTVYRWMARLDFPRPTQKRPLRWDRRAVEAWWMENWSKVGRHPTQQGK